MASRLSQELVEVLLLNYYRKARLSQLPVETVLNSSNRRSRSSQLPIEVIYSLRTIGAIRLSQIPIEVLVQRFTPISTGKKYGPIVQCV